MWTIARAIPLSLLLIPSQLVHSGPVSERGLNLPRATSNYSALVVFGDSLSDNGNGSQKISNGTWPPSFYYQGRFSNGPVWNEYVASNLSIPLYNYATGGATTSNRIIQGYTGNASTIPVPSTDEQVAAFLSNTPTGLDFATAIFAVTGGANDLFFNPNVSAYISMSVLADSVSRLQKKGAQNFLFLNYYDASMIPYDTYIKADIKIKNKEWSENFQDALERLQDSTPYSYLYSLATDLFPRLYYYGEPTHYGYDQFGAYGSCVTGTYQETPNLTICNNADKHVFWDEYHPTTRTHAHIAAGILRLLGYRSI